MLSEYQELSLLSVVSGTSRSIRQLTWKDGVGGKSDGSWANELDVGKLFPENGLVMELSTEVGLSVVCLHLPFPLVTMVGIPLPSSAKLSLDKPVGSSP